MRLFIVRHADPDYPNKTITEAGHLEARSLADRFARTGLDRIYVSPLGRAMHTMQYTADRLGLGYEVLEWVQEISGFGVEGADGQRIAAWNIPGEVIRARPLPTALDWHTRPPFDNPDFLRFYRELGRESDAFLARHGYHREEGRYRITAANRDRIAVFCHGGFGLTWLAHLLDIPLTLFWSSFLLSPSSVTTVLFEARSEEYAVPRCLAVADTSHLYAAGLPIQPAGIMANRE